MKRLSKICFVVILALGCGGCAIANKLQTIPTGFSVEGKEESVVIGRMVFDPGTVFGMKPIGFFDRLDKMELMVGNETTGKIFIIVCDQSGSDSNFYVALSPGRYRLAKWQKGSGGWEMQSQGDREKGVFTSPPIGRFEVGKSQVIYIGMLKFIRRGFLETWQVENKYEDAVNSFRGRYPQINQEIMKSLMQLE